MKGKSFGYRFNGQTIALFVLVFSAMAVVISCAKSKDEQLFAPADFPTCGDGILNQGEYFIDCGGPCEACAINSEVKFQVVDSTWTYPNKTDKTVKSNFEASLASGNWVTIYAVDTLQGIQLTFSLDKTWRGIHKIDSFPAGETFLGYGYYVDLESGIIEVTNVDTINNYITGKFSFNCKPDGFSGKRISLYSGEFKDIRTTNPL